MSVKNKSLKSNTFSLIAWIFILPFLAAWPFLSAFPAISLIGSSTFDLTASLNLVFFVTGFWAVAAVFLFMWWLTNGKLRLTYRSDKGLLLGLYATLWTGLYIIASMANR